MAKPNYSKPASQVDLEERQSKDYVPPAQLLQGKDPEPSKTGFVGVDAVYQNYANDTEAPRKAEGGPEAKVEKNAYDKDADFEYGKTEDGEVEEEDEDEDSSSNPPSTNTPPTS